MEDSKINPNDIQNQQPVQPLEPPVPQTQPNPQTETSPAPLNASEPFPEAPAPVQPPIQQVVTPTTPMGGGVPPQQQYNSSGAGSGAVKKIIISIISLVILVVIGAFGYFIYKSQQYSEENKVSIAYIKAVKDKDTDEIVKIYDTQLTKKIKKFEDVYRQIYDLSSAEAQATAPYTPDQLEKALIDEFMTNGEQYVDIPSGEPSRTGVTMHSDANPNYIVSAYKVGDKEYSVALVYDGDKPMALLIKEGSYNYIEDFNDLYNDFKDELSELDKATDELEAVLEEVQAQEGDTSQFNAGIKNDVQNLFN